MKKLLLIALLFSAQLFAQVSGAGQLGCPAAPITGNAWTTATSVNTTQILATNVNGAQLLVTLDQGTTLTVGAISFQGDPGDGTFVTLAPWQIVDPTTAPFTTIGLPYTLQASTNKQFLILMYGMYRLQLKLTTAITGSATVTPFTTLNCFRSPDLAFQQSGPWTTNVTQFGGTNVDTNSGSKSVGTLRVVLATDQPALSNKLLVTPDSVALPANQSTNEAQINGVTPDMNSGNKSPGTQRVVLATDQPQLTNKLLVTPDADAEVVPVATATTTNATSTCYLTSAASTNSTNCKGSAGNVYGIYVLNTTTTNYFLRMYNSSSAPTCSSATGFVETIPALGAAANGGGISRPQVAQGYGTGIGFCLTGGGSSTDNTNAATGLYVTILYK